MKIILDISLLNHEFEFICKSLSSLLVTEA